MTPTLILHELSVGGGVEWVDLFGLFEGVYLIISGKIGWSV